MSGLARTFDFEGRALTSYRFRGRECWIAQDVARVLAYDTKGWSSSWRRWTAGGDAELVASADYQVLRGDDLREFKAVSGVTADPAVTSTGRLTILFEAGVNVVCLKTEKPLGRKLRRFLAERVLPAMRQQAADAQALRDEFVELSLRLAAAQDTTTIWETETVVDICKLYRKPWDGTGPWPAWLKQPLGAIYRIVLGETIYRELKNRNPDPRDGSLNYQFLTQARHRLMVRDMGRVTAILRMSATHAQFFDRLRGEFGRGPRRLDMGTAS